MKIETFSNQNVYNEENFDAFTDKTKIRLAN